MADRVFLFDTTLRDGEQSPGNTMNTPEKLRVAKQLEALGVDIIEAGFPIASEGDFEAVRLIAESIKNSEVAGLARANDEDIDRAWEAIKVAKKPRIHTFISTSDIHLRHQFKKNKEEILNLAVNAVKRAKRYTDNVEFSAMDATRSDRDYLCKVFEAVIDAGANTLNIPDTVGYAVPDEFGGLIRYIKTNVPNISEAIISVHCHNDLGLAVANSIAAIQNGARQIECTVNGIGERAGNASLEEIVMILRTRKDLFGLDTRVKTEKIYRTSRLITSITGVPVQPNKAIVGANAFAHESGIHQDGLLKSKITYEIMTPKSVGIPKSSLVLGKHSGRHAFRERIIEMGYSLEDKEINLAFKRFKALSDIKKDIYNEDIEMIIMDEIYKIPEKYELVYLNVTCGKATIPTATVKIDIDGTTYQDVGVGVGPVDATYKIIKKLVKTNSKLLRFSINSITQDMDAQGEVFVKLEEKGHAVIGKGADTDIIVASAKAYINGLNKLEYLKGKKTGDI
ncbi:MAG TPA: 2-isopropylmalate synthase [Syntrophorhabdus sp.]|nr:2-isopropylmalate synthase [Syntrophorhabdus sp.]HNQ46085.1 2-isopropylmalate synthase [Syntrophorhabdus sp.]HNS78148.1 2-isopropylmalate synthase [Syntrophorhabdus sp.]HPB38158.1 2-isopropylmalate synthase [Syntrophorhabdus sp.]HPW35143.1 2-isopropylmalate synthase [Syntrophorhabdus sp.]